MSEKLQTIRIPWIVVTVVQRPFLKVSNVIPSTDTKCNHYEIRMYIEYKNTSE